MKEKQANNELYDLLNKAFSANYTCLRIANQEGAFSGDLIQTRDQVFKRKGLKEHWLAAKMKDAAGQRHDLLDAFSKAKFASFADLDMDGEDKRNKDLLMRLFNQYYGTNKSFEECFDGYEILDEDFKAIFELFDERKTIPSTRLGMSMLLNVYYNFLNYWTDRTFVISTCDIIDTLSDDLNSSGYRTFYFGHPRNPQVSVISKAEIEEMILTVYNFITKFETELKIQKKKSASAEKMVKKKPSDETKQQYFESQFESTRISILEEKVKALSFFLTVLDKRLSATGKDLEDSKILRFTEGVFDFTSGINVFDENNTLKVDKTYIHDLERKHLTFLFKQVGLECPLDKKQAQNQSEKQNQ